MVQKPKVYIAFKVVCFSENVLGLLYFGLNTLGNYVVFLHTLVHDYFYNYEVKKCFVFLITVKMDVLCLYNLHSREHSISLRVL